MKVVLDPGHGGTDDVGHSTARGVRGLAGTLEKDVTLRLAKLVAERLGGDAVLTRSADQNLSLAERAEVARREGAAAFLSLHANGDRPGQRGVETWVHEASNGSSLQLARRIQTALAPAVGPDRGVKRGPLAVLTPQRLGPATAACSIEVDFLDDPEGERQLNDDTSLGRIADAIAEAVRSHFASPATSYGRRRPLDQVRAPARTLDDGNWFTDTAELDAYLRDTRAADTTMASSRDDARAFVQQCQAAGGSGAWPSLDRTEVTNRLLDLIDQPRLIQQGALNLCGPAAMICMWNARDPLSFARFACELFEKGRSRIGNLTIAPRQNLVTRDYAAMLPRMGGAVSPQADWMVLGAIRNADDVFWQWTGDPKQNVAGMTTPGELTDWLRATGIYRTIKNEGNWVSVKGIPHALDLIMARGTDIAMLINANMLAAATGRKKDSNWILNQFPNHFIVLMSEVTQDVSTNEVYFTGWTWGDTTEYRMPWEVFRDNYYGTVTARM